MHRDVDCVCGGFSNDTRQYISVSLQPVVRFPILFVFEKERADSTRSPQRVSVTVRRTLAAAIAIIWPRVRVAAISSCVLISGLSAPALSGWRAFSHPSTPMTQNVCQSIQACDPDVGCGCSVLPAGKSERGIARSLRKLARHG